MEDTKLTDDLSSQIVRIGIIVNGQEKNWGRHDISFEEVVLLAFEKPDPNPDTVYTVTYRKGPGNHPQGSMVKGDVVKIIKGMIFNVTPTTKS